MAKTTQPNKNIRPTIFLAAILAVAVFVRIVFMVQLQRSGLSDFLSLDSRLFYAIAHTLSAGGTLPPGALTFNPFYPAFLVVIFKIFGDGLLAPRIVQFILGILTVVLAYVASSRLAGGANSNKKQTGRNSGKVAAIVAAAFVVLHSPFLLYEGMILASAFEVFFLTAAFVLAIAYDRVLTGGKPLRLGSRQIPAWVVCLVLGGVCGAGAVARPNLFFLLIAALPVWLLVRNRGKRKGLVGVAIFAAGVMLFLAPPIFWNAKNTGRFVPVTSQGGFNFYVGNGPGATGMYIPPEDVRANVFFLPEDVKAKAERATGRTMTQEEVSRFYFRETFEHIGGHPITWLTLLGTKLVLFLGPSFDDLPNMYFYKQSCTVLKLLFLPFTVIAALGICGFIVLLRRGRNRAVVSIFLVCGVVSVLLFFVNSRYRLPTVPVLIALSALFIDWAVCEIKRKRLGPLALMVALATVFVLFFAGQTGWQRNNGAAYAALGMYYIEKNDKEKADKAFIESHRADPDRIGGLANYGRVLASQGRYEEAAEVFARAYVRVPRFPLLAIQYGMALVRLDRNDEARRLFLEGTTADLPRDRALACRLLAEMSMREGKNDEGIEWVERALEIFPGEPELTEMLRRFEAAPR